MKKLKVKKTAASNKKKRKSTIVKKLMIPVIMLGVLGVVLAFIGLYALNVNQTSSEDIANEGMEIITTLDNMKLIFEKSEKMCLAQCSEPFNTDMQEKVQGELASYSELFKSNYELLAGKTDWFSPEGIELLDATYNMIVEAELTLQDIIHTSMSNKELAFTTLHADMEIWTETIVGNIDTLIEENNSHIASMKNTQKNVYTQSIIVDIVLTLLLIMAIVASVAMIVGMIVRPLKKQKNMLEEIICDINSGQGDLTKRLELTSNDEIGALSEGINTFIETLQNIMSKIVVNSASLNEIVGNVSDNVRSAGDNANDISYIMEKLALAMEEVSETTNSVTDNTYNVESRIQAIADQSRILSEYAQDMKKRANDLESIASHNMETTGAIIGEITSELNEAIENSKSVEKVDQLTGEILSISEQTNLLALNASIEAARAGDAGRGFAVVADEIRALAESSRNTANRIQSINEMVIYAVRGLSESSERILTYVNDVILKDYDMFLKGGKQYNEDATHIDSSMASYVNETAAIMENVRDMAESIDGINKAVDESTRGVNDVASNIEKLVNSITDINGQMSDNSKVANSLKEEADNFV